MEEAAQAPPVAVARGRRPPQGLGALLIIVGIVGMTWALLVPPWQTPDELDHFAYSQSLAESFVLPGTAGRPALSSDVSAADASVGASGGAFFPRFSPPDWSHADATAYAARERAAPPLSRTNGGGPSSATGNPPLYYVIAGLGSWIDHGGTAFGRLYTTRMLGVALLLVTTLGAWLLAGEVFARRRLPQLLCGATAGLLPMATFISTSVNPDALLMTAWTLALWLGARVINRGVRNADASALCAVTAAAILTKATSYALVVPVLAALFIGWRRRPREERRRTTAHLAVAGLVLVIPVLGWVALAHSLGGTTITNVSSAGHAFNVRQFLSYVWQFYFPRLPFLTLFRNTPNLPVWDIWVHELTGVFGWADVYFSPWVYTLAGWIAAALGVSSVALLARRRRPGAPALFAFFALCVIALLGLLHVTEYRVLISGGGQFLQGRYLLPVVSLLGLAVALVAGRLPARLRAPGGVLVLAGLLAFQCLSLATVVQAYYL